jgi:hypothetical protein
MIRAWALPLIVFAIAVPIAAGFLLAGPALGLAVGALVAAAIVIAVARMKPETRIEVAAAPDERHRTLVVALASIDEPDTATEVAGGLVPGSDVLVLAPATNSLLAHWADDLREAREEAQRRLVLSVGTLATAGVEARGRVGDSDVVQAVEDALREFAADDAVLVAHPVVGRGAEARALADLRVRLDLPLRLVEAG